MLHFDHVLRGVRDLDAAAAAIRAEHGLASVDGGVHPGWGTGNRIVPLGGDYVELIGVVDPAAAAESPVGAWLTALTADGDRWAGWCLRADDLDAVVRRLSLEVTPGSRELPGGGSVSWRLAGLAEAMAEPGLPFFIAWDDGSEHPGAAAAPHLPEPYGIAWIEVAGEPDRIGRWLDGAPLQVRFADGEPGVRAVGIGSSAGEIILR